MSNGFIRFQGTLTAVSPISVSYPDREHALPRTPHGEVFLNGGTLRGVLRKAALRSMWRLLAVAEGKHEQGLLTLTDAYMFGSGIDRTREVNNERSDGVDPVGEQLLRQINPLLSLFGRWNLPSRLECGELRTSTANVITVGQGARHDQFAREPDSVELLSEDDREALLREARSARESVKQIEAIRQEVRKIKRAYGVAKDAGESAEAKRLGEELRRLEQAEKDSREEREGAEHSIQHPLAGYEAISSGSELSSRLGLINGRTEYLGILLHALAEFARDPQIGGHRNIGAGVISGRYDVSQWNVGELTPVRLGSISFDDDGFIIEGEALQQAYDHVANPETIKSWDFHTHTIAAARAAHGEG